MEDSMLPSPPPKPDFTSRIKLKHRYTELKSIFYEIKNRSNGYKAELSEKEAKENKLRSECDLILDQIELIRTRLPLPSNDDLSLEEEPERKRIKRYQTHDPSLPFLYDSDGDEDAAEEDADGYNERDEESEGGRTEMDGSSSTSLGTQSFGAHPSRPPIDQDMDGEEDADADADGEVEVDEDDEDAEADEDDSEDADDDAQLQSIQSYRP